MKIATVADLRNHFPRVAQWIAEGEKVQIRKRGKAFATLSPVKGKKKKVEWPDLMARLRKNFSKPVPGKPLSEIISEGRGDR